MPELSTIHLVDNDNRPYLAKGISGQRWFEQRGGPKIRLIGASCRFEAQNQDLALASQIGLFSMSFGPLFMLIRHTNFVVKL